MLSKVNNYCERILRLIVAETNAKRSHDMTKARFLSNWKTAKIGELPDWNYVISVDIFEGNNKTLPGRAALNARCSLRYLHNRLKFSADQLSDRFAPLYCWISEYALILSTKQV